MASKSSLDNKPLEIRWHGRGGQGAITAAKIIAQAAYLKGYKGVTKTFHTSTMGPGVTKFGEILLEQEE